MFFRTQRQESITDLTWKTLSQVEEPTQLDDLENIPNEERQAFFMECYRLSRDEALQRVLRILIKEQATHILQNVENQTDLLCTRSSILGIDAVRRRLDVYASRIQEPDAPFDPFAVF